jgi:hypothetical protein
MSPRGKKARTALGNSLANSPAPPPWRKYPTRVPVLDDALAKVRREAPDHFNGLVRMGEEAVALPLRAATEDIRLPLQVIHFVANAGLVSMDQVVNHFFRKNGEDMLAARPRARAALKRLMVRGYLNARPIVLGPIDAVADPSRLVGHHYFTKGLFITQRASADFNIPLPPTLREDLIGHHLKTMDALLRVEESLFEQGYDTLGFKAEAQLLREQFRGRIFDGQQNVLPKFPDAQLTVRGPDGTVSTINVEYVTAKYTNSQIQEKHDAFSGPTVWAADSAATAKRVEAVTGEEPLLV